MGAAVGMEDHHMIETILIARDRKTGKDILLAGREVPFRGQLEKYKELAGTVSDDYSNAILAVVQPHKKPLKFITKTEGEDRAKVQAAAVAKAEKEAKAETAKKSAAGKKAAKTETKTEGEDSPKTETK